MPACAEVLKPLCPNAPSRNCYECAFMPHNCILKTKPQTEKHIAGAPQTIRRRQNGRDAQQLHLRAPAHAKQGLRRRATEKHTRKNCDAHPMPRSRTRVTTKGQAHHRQSTTKQTKTRRGKQNIDYGNTLQKERGAHSLRNKPKGETHLGHRSTSREAHCVHTSTRLNATSRHEP